MQTSLLNHAEISDGDGRSCVKGHPHLHVNIIIISALLGLQRIDRATIIDGNEKNASPSLLHQSTLVQYWA